MKLTVGQKVWLKKGNYRNTDKSEALEMEVEKVGSKYFQLKNFRGRFKIENGYYDSEFGISSKVYEDKQALLDEQEMQSLSEFIKAAFRTYGNLPFTLEQLRQIKVIIKPNETT